jgi:GxxExxY protein
MSERESNWVRINSITEKVIGCAIEVHRAIGPGLLESAYEECLCYELKEQGLNFKRQVPLPVVYKGVKLDCGYVLDIIVEDLVILEIKAVERVMPIHEAQLLSYLRMLDKRIGLILNFNMPIMKNGIKRIVNGL